MNISVNINKDGSSISDASISDIVDRCGISHSFIGEYYSPSFISSWSNCPTKVLLDSLSEDIFVSQLAIGLAVHYLLEKRFSVGKVSQDDKDYVVKTILHGDASLYNKVRSYYYAYDKINDSYEPDTSHFTEKTIIDSPHPLGADIPKIKGIIDRIDISSTRVRVLDYKTASRQLDNNKYIDQLTIYKWIVESYLGVDVDDICVASLFVDDPKLLYPDITLKSQSLLIDKICDVDEEVHKSAEDNIFKKRTGYGCKFCRFYNSCIRNENIEVKVDERRTDCSNDSSLYRDDCNRSDDTI